MKADFIAPDGYKLDSPAERCIVSCDIGNHYAQDFLVTKENCNRYCGDAWRLYYDDYPDGCPPHSESMYAFKVYAIEEAIRAGFRFILWMDSSLAPLAPIEPLWRTIEQHGWYAAPQYSGITEGQPWRHWASTVQATLGEWCSDAALGIFGMSREAAFSIPLALTGLVGLDMQNPMAQTIWRMHKEFHGRGVFNGAHVNKPGHPVTAVGNGKFHGHVSHDARVQGHRHDETSLSFILHRLGLRPVNLGFWTLESKAGFIGQFVTRFNIQYQGASA
jgi:hypothetical protein